jgi:Nbl1 / Borealin N terminal
LRIYFADVRNAVIGRFEICYAWKNSTHTISIRQATLDGTTTKTSKSVYSLTVHGNVSLKERVCRVNSLNSPSHPARSVTTVSTSGCRHIYSRPRQTSHCEPRCRTYHPLSRLIFIVVVRDRTARLRNHYNLLASTLKIRGEARMSRVPSHLRGIKIKELREMQKRGVAREKQLVADVLGTRLLASASRPTLKRYFLCDDHC